MSHNISFATYYLKIRYYVAKDCRHFTYIIDNVVKWLFATYNLENKLELIIVAKDHLSKNSCS